MKTTNGFNMFTNDGSFLDQFKQMKEKNWTIQTINNKHSLNQAITSK